MSFFKGKETVTQLTPDKEKWQLGMGEQLADWAQKYMGQYQPGKDLSKAMLNIYPSLFWEKNTLHIRQKGRRSSN